MNKSWRPLSRLSLLAIPILLLAAGATVQHSLFAQGTPATPAAQATPDTNLVYDYASRITRLVQNGKFDELSQLSIPNSGQTLQIHDWTSQYVSQIQKQTGQRDKQFGEAVVKAQSDFKQNSYDKAMFSLVQAYRMAKDPDAFLKQDWVIDMAAKTAVRAKDLEEKGQWLESLELFSDLNILFEIDTRFKADKQRLEHRTRLLLVYTPKTLYDLRKALNEREEEKTGTAPATKPAEETPNFTRWQDGAEKVSAEMLVDALDRAVADWVEKTDYPTLIKGGVGCLRLFLTTPELATEFPGLANPAAKEKFGAALDAALARATGGGNLTSSDVETIINNLIKASNDSVKLPERVVIMEFADGAIEGLDPFTAIIWPHELDEFEKNTRGSFGGVGIKIGLEGGQLKVVTPLENSPAFRANIQAGDVITAIEGASTANITTDQAVHSITGIPGTVVNLTIKSPDGKERIVALKRDIIKVASVEGFERDPKDKVTWNFMIDPENKIGYMCLTGFQEDTAKELNDALTALKAQGLKGVILDLRFNPGGLLSSAVEISDMFLDGGTIVSTNGRSPRTRQPPYIAHQAVVIPNNMPIIVLVNEYSASASEILSGALKDLRRAMIVGHRSFGKGSVQNLLPIGSERRPNGEPEARMKLTTAYYYLPDGESLHRRDNAKTWGVDPHVTVDLTPSQNQDVLNYRRETEIIHPQDFKGPASTTSAFSDTQLDTALLMMRLQLLQAKP